MNESLPFDRLTAVVNRPEWDVFMVWATQEKNKCYDRLEVCTPENLKNIQGELNIWKRILTLRQDVSNYMSNKGTKPQS
jgi:hypothetical protein